MTATIHLNFSGPFDFYQLARKDNAYLPGVYIWGFEDAETKTFKPYYVGKSQDNIVKRIAQHIADIRKPNSTYMRLTEVGMARYQDEFPIITRNESKKQFPNGIWKGHQWNKKISDYIAYLNNKEFLEDNYMEVKLLVEGKDYPVNCISSLSRFEDILKNKVNNGELRVCYAVPKSAGKKYFEPENENEKKAFFELLEATVKFSLKKRTVSKSLSFDKLKSNQFLIEVESLDCSNLFNYKGTRITAHNFYDVSRTVECSIAS